MLRFFQKNRHWIDEQPVSPNTDCFRILPVGRASIHPDGAVFLNVGSGVIFKSNRVGSRIWQGLQNRETPAEMAAQISREYGVPEEQAAEDTAHFLAQLETEGFLARSAQVRGHGF